MHAEAMTFLFVGTCKLGFIHIAYKEKETDSEHTFLIRTHFPYKEKETDSEHWK